MYCVRVWALNCGSLVWNSVFVYRRHTPPGPSSMSLPHYVICAESVSLITHTCPSTTSFRVLHVHHDTCTPIRTHRRSTLIIFVSLCLLAPMCQNREISRPRVPQATRISVLLCPPVPHFRVPPYACEPFHLSSPICVHLRPSMSIHTHLL